MGAKFIIDRRCAVKSSLTLVGLIEAIKYRGLLRRIHDLAAAGFIPPCDAGARLDLVMAPEPGVPGELTIEDLKSQTEALMSHRLTCRQCPSSLGCQVGGCIAYVPYPLSEGMEFLLWTTAVKALRGELPAGLLPTARAFAAQAAEIRQTPFAEGMRSRGDLLGARPRLHQSGLLWRRERISSAQVLDAFFIHDLVSGDPLRIHAGFLTAVLAVGRALEPALGDEERRAALLEDVAPYAAVHELMGFALEQRLGVYVWP